MAMPDVPPPEACPTWTEWLQPVIDRLPPEIAVHFTRERRCTLKEAFRFV